MLSRFERPEDSKELYFKLSSSLQICSYDNCSQTMKLAGVYAIFKGEVCYYVGQSQNIASRLTQHLFGKYESADMIIIFPAVENGFGDFYDRGKEARKSILENNEFKFMEHYKPIENLITPGTDFEYNTKGLFNCLDEDDEFYSYGHINIYIDNFNIDVTTGIGSMELTGRAYNEHNSTIVHYAKSLDEDEMKERGLI